VQSTGSCPASQVPGTGRRLRQVPGTLGGTSQAKKKPNLVRGWVLYA